MASNISDDARRAEILRRALLGLEEDIDDLRAELLDALPDYEQRLRQHTDILPGWLKLPASRIRQLFHFAEDGVEPQGILGPRTVALGAGRVEAFVERWFDEDAETVLAAAAVEPHDELVDDYTQMRTYLDELRAEANHTAAQAQRTLDGWLDAVLTQLDARRETDIEAIEALVREGEIGRGRNARQEIADLWEEQRHQAAELQERWEPITGLVEEGLEITGEGLDELDHMIERAREGLIGANPALDERLEPPRCESTPSDNTDETDETDETDATTEVDDAGSVTVPDQAGQTDLAIGQPRETDVTIDQPQETDVLVDEPSDTIPDSGFVHGIVPLDEPTSEPEMGALESSSVSDYSEPQLAESSSVERSDISTQRLYTRTSEVEDDEAAADQSSEIAASEPQERVAAEAEDEGEADEEPPSQEPAPEPIRTSCFRIRAGYVPAQLGEVVAVLGPPLVFLLGVAALCIAHLLGDASSENPLTRWSWMPAALAVAAGWLMLIPFVLGWRTRWSGWKVEVLKASDVRQQEELVIEHDALVLGPQRWPYAHIDAPRLRRWESPPDDIYGWVLMFEPRAHSKVYMVAPEPSRQRWQNSPMELVDVPYEAWQLDGDDFVIVRDRVIE